MEINLKVEEVRKVFNERFNELKDKKFILFESKPDASSTEEAKPRISENEGISCR